MARSLTPTHDLPSVVEGDSYSVPVTFDTASGDPIDITDWTVSFTIADRDSQDPIITKTNTTHDDAAGGKTTFDLAPAETAGVTNSKRYDIQVEKPDGTVRTVVLGTIGFIDGVTD